MYENRRQSVKVTPLFPGDDMTTTTAVLCIGDELLDGRVRDQNAAHLLGVSRRRGLQITETRTVGDHTERIAAALKQLTGVDIAVVCGGLGPTSDDMTRRAAAKFADQPLVEDEQTLSQLRQRFDERGLQFTDNQRRQCAFPRGATILATEVGTAAGFRLQVSGTDYFFFPGVPREFQWFAKHHLPRGTDANETSFQRRLVFYGRGESSLETSLGDLVADAERRSVHVGFRARFPVVEIHVAGPAEPAADVADRIRDQLRPWLIAEDDEKFAARIGRRLVECDATITVAESCTAGLLGAHITAVSGSSRYFERGYLTYADQAKTDLVGVDPDSFAAVGAVSARVVAQMAAGARRRSGATFALAISGIAGPTGGSPDKPVGTVDIGLATPDGVFHRRCQYEHRNRRQVRVLSVYTALSLLLWHLEDRLDEHRIRGPFSYSSVARGIDEHDG